MTQPPDSLVEKLGRRLMEVGYDEPRVLAAFGAADGVTLASGSAALDAKRIPQRGEVPNLIRLFMLEQAIPKAAAVQALGNLGLDQPVRAGVLAQDGDAVSATVHLRPYGSLLIASDLRARRNEADVVGGYTPSAATLAAVTVRRPVTGALDLGTGSGLQALLAASHSERVVGVDINPRALMYARMNATLNQRPNLEFRLGSWFEPVADERFDLIAVNPPYVVSPDHELVYRDSGLPGDHLVQTLTRRAADHLAEGGFAVLLCNWTQTSDGDWWSRPASWVDRDRCDALVLRHSTDNVILYAAKWNQHLYRSDPGGFRAAMERWVSYYQQLGISRISFGAILLRRRSGNRHWLRAFDDIRPEGAAGDQLLRIVAGCDFLEAVSDQQLLEAVLQPVPLCHAEAPDPVTLGPGQGLGLSETVEWPAAGVLPALDGTRRVREAIDEAARRLAISPAPLREAVLPLIRRLLELGLVSVRDEQPVRA